MTSSSYAARSTPHDKGRQFIVDATRAGEGVITDEELQERYELSATDLQDIAEDKAVGRAIRDERERRVRTGLAAKELAAKFFVKSPEITDPEPRRFTEA